MGGVLTTYIVKLIIFSDFNDMYIHLLASTFHNRKDLKKLVLFLKSMCVVAIQEQSESHCCNLCYRSTYEVVV